LTPHVLQVPDANHGMVLPDLPLARSAAVLGQVVTAVESFSTHMYGPPDWAPGWFQERSSPSA
jgi:hypothetical protein